MSRRVAVSISMITSALLCAALVGLPADPLIAIGVTVAQTKSVALAGQEQVLGV